jgi:hypothetical protein
MLRECLMRPLKFRKGFLLAIIFTSTVVSSSGIAEVGETSLTFSRQEGSGVSLGVGFDVPRNVYLSRLGFEMGERLYRGGEGQEKTLKATEYGPFIGLDLYQQETFKFTWKVAWNRLDLPAESTKKSLSRFNFVLGAQSLTNFFWSVGIGLSWRDDDHSTVEVGRDKLDKTLLFFPSLGFGLKI